MYLLTLHPYPDHPYLSSNNRKTVYDIMLRPNTIYTPPDTISIKNDKFFLMSMENFNRSMNNLVSKAWGRAVCQSKSSDTRYV